MKKKKSVNGNGGSTIKQHHNMLVHPITKEDRDAEFTKSLYKSKVGISTKSRVSIKGKPSVVPNLVKYRRSWTKEQIRNVLDNNIENNVYNPSKSVFVGTASKTERSLTRAKDSKVVGLIFNPLDSDTLERLEDTFVSDGEVRQSIAKYWGLILGDELQYKLGDCYQNYGDDDERNSAYDQILQHENYTEALDKTIRVLNKIKFKNAWETICNLGSIFGRGAAEIIRDDKTNDPVYLNVLYSQLLGDPILNKYHQFIGVEYEDLPDEKQHRNMPHSINRDHKPAFKKDKLLYYAHDDVPVTVGAKYYGLSTLESLLDASEAKRIMIQKEIKEWVAKSHTGNIILSTDEPLPQEECDLLAERLTNNQGNVMVINYKMMAQMVAVNTNIEKFEALINTLNAEILRYISLPRPVGGYEEIQNYASIAKTLVVWMAATLNPQRLKQKAIIKEQFVDDVFQTCLLQRKQIVLEDPVTLKLKLYDVVVPMSEDPTEAGSPKYSVKEVMHMIKARLEKNPDFINYPIEDLELNETSIPAAEINIDIALPRFNDFVEMADKILSWVRERMMTKKKGLEIAGMEDQIDDIKMLDQEAQENREALMGKGVMFDDQGKPIPGNVLPQQSMTDANVQEKVTGNDKMQRGAKSKTMAINPKYKAPEQRTKAETQSLNKKLAQKENRRFARV